MDTGLLAALLGYAAVDSVNPCTFYIYATLVLATTLTTRSRGAALRVAAAFIAGVYVGYTSLGLAAAAATEAAIRLLPPWLLPAALLGYAGVLAAQAYTERAGRGAPLRTGGRLAGRAVAAAGRAAAALGLGLLASFTLLPCTSGPLFSFLALAVSRGYTLAQVAALLLLYNLVFVAPLAALGAAASQVHRVRRVEELLAEKAWLLDVAAACLLAAAALYLLAAP